MVYNYVTKECCVLIQVSNKYLKCFIILIIFLRSRVSSWLVRTVVKKKNSLCATDIACTAWARYSWRGSTIPWFSCSVPGSAISWFRHAVVPPCRGSAMLWLRHAVVPPFRTVFRDWTGWVEVLLQTF